MTALDPRLLQLSTGRRLAGDMGDLADGVAEFGSSVESQLNLMLKAIKGETTGNLHSDMECDVDAISDCFAELVSLIRHAASEARVNARQPVEVG